MKRKKKMRKKKKKKKKKKNATLKLWSSIILDIWREEKSKVRNIMCYSFSYFAKI